MFDKITDKSLKVSFGVIATLGILTALASNAFAQTTTTIDPVSTTTTLFATGFGQVALIIVGVVTAALTLLVLRIGVRMVWHALKSRGASAGI